MSDTENRKSMDDVLASIRRIVRAEKDPAGADTAEEVVPSAPETPPTQPADASEPLALTPEMRMAPGAAETDAPAEDAMPLGAAMGAVDAAESAVSDATSAVADALDPAQIKEMVREVVMEQLGGADAGELIRNVIRDELTTGEIGGNISQNVLRLIQSEVGKALGK
ncbi:MAG: hypothetical protein AAGD13_11190 [Pseudomonadota bacterium]